MTLEKVVLVDVHYVQATVLDGVGSKRSRRTPRLVLSVDDDHEAQRRPKGWWSSKNGEAPARE
jgi:hypothetical protein